MTTHRTLWIAALSGAAAFLAACGQGGEEAPEETSNAPSRASERLAELASRPASRTEVEAAAIDPATPFTETGTGLRYRVLASGPQSGVSPLPGEFVCVHYRGELMDGTEFDSSYARGRAAAFPSDRLISGWVEALALMKPGDRWELIIPADLGYGARGVGDIPPNATLRFNVELISVLNGPPPPDADCQDL